jgi:energy-coupling factor transporter ATP-binding protein EcfA2
MRTGDLLVRAKLVTEEQVALALETVKKQGGRFGDALVEMGAIDRQTLEVFLHRIPAEPTDIASTNIDQNDLLALLIKVVFTGRLTTVRQYADAIKLPLALVTELVSMAVERRILSALGTRKSDSLLDMSYTFTEEGRQWASDALERSRYVGPAPVTLEEFTLQVSSQKLTNERITMDRIRKGLSEWTIEESLLEQAGPALNAGRSILLYGPPGNGKTTVALSFAKVFEDVIYIPYAIIVEGEIIRFFDPAIHLPVDPVDREEDEEIFVRHDTNDLRWVACKRPFVLTGGELTLEMLDMRYDQSGHFYEAPLHMKALGGCLLIDDFGRQLVSPTHLLNRWIVPLENRVDYLKLNTGKTITVPFEELVIFSTNLEPEDLMDPAFLRRLPYKIEVGPPDLDRFRTILKNECDKQGIELREEIFQFIVRKLRDEKGMDFAAYQPRFIVEQVVATCRFMSERPQFKPRYIDYALNNLRVHRNEKKNGAVTSARV